MHVILKRIGETTTVSDIEEFIGPALKGGFLKKAGRIESLRIQRLQQPGFSRVEYYAVVRIEPDVAARRVIKMLNRKRCNGKPINVCEYHFRHRDNDRRIERYNSFKERRVEDRRRKNLEIKDITDERKKARIDYSLLNLVGAYRD